MAITGRPTKYDPDFVIKAGLYLADCKDEIEEFHRTRSDGSNTYERRVKVNLPTIEGLSLYLNVSRDSLYVYEKEYEEFSDVMNKLRAKQADALIRGGMSGDYNPTIAKVLLTKHGYREGIDQTTNDKDLPQPILSGVNFNLPKEDENKGTDQSV